MEQNILERILEGSMPPTHISLETLRKITNEFSIDRIIGKGGFGTVYKGVIGNKNVAVKRIMSSMTINQKLFLREVDSQMDVRHENVVRFLGLCSHTVEIPVRNPESQGYILAEIRERLLCFEYVSNGSLDEYITDELRGLEWDIRYQIIKGICAGLHYLHVEKRILHMDIKPANILLDNQMVPKITDFGLSRPMQNPQTMTSNHFSTPAYGAPENLFGRGTMSVQSDMYSLGVTIIELVTGGRKGIPDNKNNILRRWRHRWNKSTKETPLEYHHQVTECIEIGSLCMNFDAYARPSSMSQIMSKFVEMENKKINPLYWEDDMLGVEPLELRFEYNDQQQILSCSVELSNDTDGSIAFKIQKTSPLPYSVEPNKDIVKPHSKCSVVITLPVASTQDHKATLQYGTSNKQEFIVQSIKVNENLKTHDIFENMFYENTGLVDEIHLVVISEEPCNKEASVDISIGESNNMDDVSVVPKFLSFQLLQEITNGFSKGRKVGAGSYGNVYKGEYTNGEMIAVKVLHPVPGFDDELFKNEYHNLASLQHKNIVQLLGYCYETRKEFIPYNGKMVFAETTQSALCFEYMQNGSLDGCLTDESTGHDWCTRFAIIKGICQGLKYLHEELDPPMYHLDLKPAKVLLDKKMVPKIAGFNLSRFFREEQTQMTKSSLGTPGYLPPEYIDAGLISIKFDIFSLGVVIIKIMQGPRGYFRSAEMSPQQFIDYVHANWMNRLQTTSVDTERYSKQVKRCIEIALNCIDADRHKRPSIGVIFNMLNETEKLAELQTEEACPQQVVMIAEARTMADC